MRNYIDLTPYRRATVGFDNLFDRLDAQMRGNMPDSYPQFDIVKDGEDSYRIVLALPGFSINEIDIVARRNELAVSAKPAANDAGHYLHRGIAIDAFERQFQLADFMEVGDASFEDGLLTISLRRVVPDQHKARKVAISGLSRAQGQLGAPQEAA